LDLSILAYLRAGRLIAELKINHKRYASGWPADFLAWQIRKNRMLIGAWR
jgi:hypothetical protein